MTVEILKELFIYFIVYAFLGWTLEVVYHLIINKKLINRGFLLGPLCPIYGFGAVILIVLLEKLGDNIMMVFIGGAFFASVLEFITGYVLEKLFNQKWWDYSEMKFNIKGYISLAFSIIWGFVSVFLVEILHPLVLEVLSMIPVGVMNILIPIVSGILILDIIYTVDSLIQFKKVLDGIKEVKEELQYKYENAIKMNVEEIKDKEETIRVKLKENLGEKLGKESFRYKLTHRKFLRAYPNLVNPEWVKRVKDSIGKKQD